MGKVTTRIKEIAHIDPMENKNHDPVNGKLDAIGAVNKLSMADQRKELVDDLLKLLQSTVEDKVHGIRFLTQVDLVGNYLHQLKEYAQSLRSASATLRENYPTSNDQPLEALEALADIMLEGADRTAQYLEAVRPFSDDLNNIRANIYTQIQTLYAEI
jgi:hypothetical protein